jgi:hypothetical protein
MVMRKWSDFSFGLAQWKFWRVSDGPATNIYVTKLRRRGSDEPVDRCLFSRDFLRNTKLLQIMSQKKWTNESGWLDVWTAPRACGAYVAA